MGWAMLKGMVAISALIVAAGCRHATAVQGVAGDADDCGAGPCVPAPRWSDRFQRIATLALDVDPTGRVALAGRAAGTDFGGGPITPDGGLYVVWLGAGGEHVRSLGFTAAGDGGLLGADDMSLDPAGAVVVVGSSDRPVDFGGGPRCVGGSVTQGFVFKLDAKGHHVHSRCFATSPSSVVGPVHVVSDAAGNAFVGGTFQGSVDFGTGPVPDTMGPIFLAKLGPMGEPVWLRTFPTQGGSATLGGLGESSGSVIVTGTVQGSIDIGGGMLSGGGAGSRNVFLARLDAGGGHIYSRIFPSASAQDAIAVAADPSGRAFITGSLAGTVDFGGGPLVSAGNQNVFIASFGSAGEPLWSKRFGGSGFDIPGGIGIDGAGDVILLAMPDGAIDFGAGPLAPTASSSTSLARFDGGGSFVGQRMISGIVALAARGRGGPFVLAGSAAEDETVDLGTGPTALRKGDFIVAEIPP